MQLAKRLRQLIAQRGLSIAELSKHTGIPVNTIHNWLAGQGPRNLSQVKVMAEYFNTSIDGLTYGSELQLDSAQLPELLKSGNFEIVLRPIANVNKGGR